MKKVFGLLLASTLVLGACGNSGNEDKEESKTESVNENKTQFKNDTLVIDDAVLKIKDTFLVNNENSDGKELAFKYEVKNKTDKDEITSRNVWIATMKAEQDSDNTVNQLEQGLTPTTGKYESWAKHLDDKIKKGKTAKGIVTYTLQNDEDVTLKATKGADGKELGTKKIDIDELKTVNYDAASDIDNDSQDSNANSESDKNQSTDNNKQSDNNQSTDGAVASANNNSSKKQQQANQATNSTEQSASSDNTQQTSKSSNNQTNDSQQMSDAEIADWNKNKPTTHDESQMQGVGGHPSAFDPSISKDSQGVRKVDENGDEYYDATGQ
ncbi:DUF5067 domain-containing protein [Staphylococcus saprophyticus]|nr:DUF5067 domain-containing protein [Staphylococcus saprophyticus]